MRRHRFAPSPTGPLHFGSLVAAVGSFLQARSQRAEWRVRIEDIDTPRVVAGAADAILRTLECYGLEWDGPIVYQSQRLMLYQAALDTLRASGFVYACTCSRQELAGHAPSGRVYPGTCRTGTRHQNRPAALRVRTQNEAIGFHDALQGEFEQNLEGEVGDFVLQRADGIFSYHLAVVVDDAAQGITDIVRGSDLLDSTPRQLYLQKLLGLPTPRYCHLPIAIDAQGAKLSKQTAAPALDQHAPVPALVQALYFLGQQPPPELARAVLAEVWGWAHANWRLARVPAVVRQPGCATIDGLVRD